MQVSWREVWHTYVLGERFFTGWLAILFLAGVAIWREMRDARAKQRVLRDLRRLPREYHSEEIARFLHYHFREWLRVKIAEEPLPQGEPPVERFVFPNDVRAWNERAFWVVVILALVPAAGVFLVEAGPRARVGSILTLAVLAGFAWLLRRRAAYLESVIEVSPFAIREVHANGLRRTLFWKDAGWLINRSRLGRVDVTSHSRRDHIAVHYDRLEFYKALQLIIQYGGFGPSDAAA